MKPSASAWWLGAAALFLMASCDSARNATEDTSTASTTVETAPPADVAFTRDLTQGEYRFQIQSTTADNGQQLTIKTRRGDALVTDPVRLNVKGNVTDAVMGDLNGNGNPELYVFTSGTGSGSYGGVEAYEFKDKSFVPLKAPQNLSSDMATGYMGQDKYEVRGNKLVRTFPVFGAADANGTASPTGETRTIEYSLNSDNMLMPGTMPATGSTPSTTTPPKQ
ncbi:PliI family lysozyme inhibitor of I-type lysozyme [Hymenobacter busanensis]|nr:PliI family lysozyme inhibitor of I-type lysozyme [Hymenobacter busanensis]QHJ06626.1 hypothetical protein GUY19_04635 [Hymenobacter busanensis]